MSIISAKERELLHREKELLIKKTRITTTLKQIELELRYIKEDIVRLHEQKYVTQALVKSIGVHTSCASCGASYGDTQTLDENGYRLAKPRKVKITLTRRGPMCQRCHAYGIRPSQHTQTLLPDAFDPAALGGNINDNENPLDYLGV